MPHDLSYYDMVGLKCPETQIADLRTENERLRGLLRQVRDGLLRPNEAERWVYLDEVAGETVVCYSFMLFGWLAVVSEELSKGTDAAQSSEGSGAAGS